MSKDEQNMSPQEKFQALQRLDLEEGSTVFDALSNHVDDAGGELLVELGNPENHQNSDGEISVNGGLNRLSAEWDALLGNATNKITTVFIVRPEVGDFAHLQVVQEGNETALKDPMGIYLTHADVQTLAEEDTRGENWIYMIES